MPNLLTLNNSLKILYLYWLFGSKACTVNTKSIDLSLNGKLLSELQKILNLL